MKSRSPLKNSSNDQKLKIIIRIRPVLNEEDPNEFVSLEDDDTLQIRRPGNHSFMKFSNILPPQSTQKDVFYRVQDSIKQFLKGVNTTIFAYGQTGAGKTYSIIGNYSPYQSQQNLFNLLSSKQRGILSRSLEMIMSLTAKDPDCKLTVSFFQIYNQKIYDLYNYTNYSLQIRQGKNGQISIPQLTAVRVTHMQEVIQFLMAGLKNRVTGSTQANAKSSRSHSIFQINLQRQQGNQTTLSSWRIVDLAGSQKFKIPADLTNSQKQIRIQQLTSINGSLSCLGHCISALIDKSRTHIPFRNSKLTRILSDSLLGQGKMRFIICISPSITAATQTFSTLQFANRAKRAIFDRSDKSPSMQKKKSQPQEVSILKRDLQKQREARIGLQKQIIQLRKQNNQLKSQNNRLMSKLSGGDCKKTNQSEQINHKIGYYDYNKQNDFKQQMLKLTIFQKNRLNNMSNPTPSNQSRTHVPSQSVSQVTSNNSKAYTNKKQKNTQFQKKIKKFIQSQSPHQSLNHNSEYSFQNEMYKFNGSKIQQKKQKSSTSSLKQAQPFWDSNKDESQQFMQRACTRMNLPDYQQLQSEMQKAREQLLNLRKKDNELQQRKLGIR